MTTTSSRRSGTLIGATYTDKGGRQENQDSISLEFTSDGLFAVVADGMGGGIDGKVFSEQAVDLLSNHLREVPSRDRPALERGIAHVAQAINSLRQGNPDYKVSGTTLVAVVLRLRDGAAEGTIVSVGDSRAYHIPAAGPAKQMTRDHIYAEQMISSGTTKAEAYQHKQALHLTYALGDALVLESVPDLFIDVRLQPDERLLLCTDGVCKHLTDKQLAQMARGAKPKQAASDIVKAAIAAGSKDNVSAAVIGYTQSVPGGHRKIWLIPALVATLAIGGGAVYAGYRATLAREIIPEFDATVTPLPTTTALLSNTSTPAIMFESTSTPGSSMTPTKTPTPTVTSTPTLRPTRTATRVPRVTATRRPTVATLGTSAPTTEVATTEAAATETATPSTPPTAPPVSPEPPTTAPPVSPEPPTTAPPVSPEPPTPPVDPTTLP